jgi:hypothetical protein
MYDRQSWREVFGGFSVCSLVLTLLLAGPPLSAGQIEKGSKLTTKIESRKRIRVFTPDGEKSVRWPVVSDEGIASRETKRGEELAKGSVNPLTLIPWNAIQTIKVRKNAGGLGALAGAVVAGVSIAVLGSGYEEDAGTIVKAMLIVMPLGALQGYLLGSLIPHWKTVYSAPVASRPVPRISLAPTARGGMALTFSLSF